MKSDFTDFFWAFNSKKIFEYFFQRGKKNNFNYLYFKTHTPFFICVKKGKFQLFFNRISFLKHFEFIFSGKNHKDRHAQKRTHGKDLWIYDKDHRKKMSQTVRKIWGETFSFFNHSSATSVCGSVEKYHCYFFKKVCFVQEILTNPPIGDRRAGGAALTGLSVQGSQLITLPPRERCRENVPKMGRRKKKNNTVISLKNKIKIRSVRNIFCKAYPWPSIFNVEKC